MITKPKPPTKKKLSEWKKAYNKKAAQPKKLPQGPKQLTENKQTKTVNGKKKATDTKGKTPNWRDSTYMKQESYLKKLLSDFNADQIRSRADVATYYGNEDNPGSAEVRSADTTRTVRDNGPGLTEEKQTKTVTTPKKKAPVKSVGAASARKPIPPKAKPRLTEYVKTSSNKPKLVDAGKGPKLTDAGKDKKKKPKLTNNAVKSRYKTVTTKGHVISEATPATKATEGLYQKQLAQARVRDKADITDDYAARGVLHSGIYAQKQGDYEQEYGQQMAETNRQKASKYADLAQQKRDFLRDQELQKEQAREDAVRRKAAAIGKVV
jgi:hypothetical protein